VVSPIFLLGICRSSWTGRLVGPASTCTEGAVAWLMREGLSTSRQRRRWGIACFALFGNNVGPSRVAATLPARRRHGGAAAAPGRRGRRDRRHPGRTRIPQVWVEVSLRESRRWSTVHPTKGEAPHGQLKSAHVDTRPSRGPRGRSRASRSTSSRGPAPSPAPWATPSPLCQCGLCGYWACPAKARAGSGW